jgi:hypothetical protein
MVDRFDKIPDERWHAALVRNLVLASFNPNPHHCVSVLTATRVNLAHAERVQLSNVRLADLSDVQTVDEVGDVVELLYGVARFELSFFLVRTKEYVAAGLCGHRTQRYRRGFASAAFRAISNVTDSFSITVLPNAQSARCSSVGQVGRLPSF